MSPANPAGDMEDSGLRTKGIGDCGLSEDRGQRADTQDRGLAWLFIAWLGGRGGRARGRHCDRREKDQKCSHALSRQGLSALENVDGRADRLGVHLQERHVGEDARPDGRQPNAWSTSTTI